MSDSYQKRVHEWAKVCFGHRSSYDRSERAYRFVEEALELAQAFECTRSDIDELINYVYGRPVGDPSEEIGGTMLTLAALCEATGYDMERCGETELSRVYEKMERIRSKHNTRPENSPLPGTGD